jgi:peptidoglycan L-alanyl-D-glutamate endopeptidase CwlK
MKGGKCDWNAPNGTWEKIGGIGKGLGLEWGGDFKSIKDRPHFQTKDWKLDQIAWADGRLKVA